ncbi:hypothetical protein ACIRJO_39165 [Streptomyces sp. NPDC102394]|uniref:hypothetical protein n=1 Tax=Streptomyces sp. NPDC102394 TaxID=3366167 RepID=UPI00380D0A9B
MSTHTPLPARPAGPLRRAGEARVAIWLDCRHLSPCEPVPQPDPHTAGTVQGVLLPGRPTLPPGADPDQIAAVLAEDRAVTTGPVNGVAGYRQAMNTALTALETAVATGIPTPPIAIEYSPVGVDAVVDARLDLAGSWEAKAMRGRAGLAGAHLLHAALRHDLATDRWTRLAARGARAPFLLWSTTAPSLGVDTSVGYAQRCLFPGTALALSPAVLREFEARGVVTGPTPLDIVEAQRIIDTLGWFGVGLDTPAG